VTVTVGNTKQHELSSLWWTLKWQLEKVLKPPT